MKKYILFIFIISAFLISTPLVINQVKASSTDNTNIGNAEIRVFINLLISIGVITPDKMPSVNAFLATLDDTSVTNIPSITVLSPNGNDNIYIGEKYTIEWKSVNLPTGGLVKIYLEDRSIVGGNSTFEIANVKDTGSFVWDTKKEIVKHKRYVRPGTDFRIKVCKNDTCDYSNSSFTIKYRDSSKPSLTLLSPRGRESVNLGDKYTIKWKSVDLSTEDSVKIFLHDKSVDCSVYSGDCPSTFEIASVKDTGSFVWDTNNKMGTNGNAGTGPNSVKVYPGSDFSIGICKENFCDTHDLAFTIKDRALDKVAGSCSSTRYTCSTGTLGAQAEYPNAEYPNKHAHHWHCNGINGGNNVLCKETKVTPDRVDASCSSTRYACETGTPGARAEYPTAKYPNKYEYHWHCNGVGGGNDTLCKEAKK